ncbi:dehydrodolichyl diphosphate synthase 2-like [Cynara cardunculus var. scolymus]|uniref:dehydrodolichyl diphosphate synthase 2-like n=1 Tax=Cynara cardunculus var. scolymus TaxID=59895 RepID=UPI000D62715D|nr:dehydrodolichyl diphosphate synthase 2-like [Cynara cardunculus var. scolymus]
MLSSSLSLPNPSSFLSNPFSLSTTTTTTTNHRLHVFTTDPFFNDSTSPEERIAIPAGLQRELIPKHVAVVMDGNRRWARLRGLMPEAGYLAGAGALKAVVNLCSKWGIQTLTVFAFSSDNWLRPKVEVDFLMKLLETALKDEVAYMLRENIRLSVIGDSSKLPKSLQEFIAYGENATKDNSHMNFVLAINYSGKYDIVQACQSIALEVRDGIVEPEEINEFMIENKLGMNSKRFPHPDLLIRTSGELRLSNFFLWQLAYTELYFTEALWPDFGEEELLHALRAFQNRPRRYGR